MYKIEVSIEFIDWEPQPGIVKCSLYDAWNNRHVFIDKIPIFTDLDIFPEDSYPQRGAIRCELVRGWTDNTGRKILTVSTEKPDGVETTTEKAEFDLLEKQINYLAL